MPDVVRLRLFAFSALLLFLELALIRWLGENVLYLFTVLEGGLFALSGPLSWRDARYPGIGVVVAALALWCAPRSVPGYMAPVGCLLLAALVPRPQGAVAREG